jgi:hypothetical protein
MAFMAVLGGLGAAGKIFTAIKDIVLVAVLLGGLWTIIHSINDRTDAQIKLDKAIASKYDAKATVQILPIVTRQVNRETHDHTVYQEGANAIAQAPAPPAMDQPLPADWVAIDDRVVCSLESARSTPACLGLLSQDKAGTPGADAGPAAPLAFVDPAAAGHGLSGPGDAP